MTNAKICPCGCGQPMPERIERFDAGPIIEDWLKCQGFTLAELQRDDRRHDVMEARRKVAEYLRGHGWSLQRIADFLDRDHTTILHMLRPRVVEEAS